MNTETNISQALMGPSEDKGSADPLSPKAIIEAIDRDLTSKRTVRPVKSNRASELGHKCLRYLVYQRTKWDMRTPPSVDLLKIFEEGNLQEKAVIRSLEDAGYEISHQQQDFHNAELNITGHIDCRLSHRKAGGSVLGEIKSINPNTFERLNCAQDFDDADWTAKYIDQINLYMDFEGEKEALMIIKNKSTGAIKIFTVYRDDTRVQALKDKARQIEEHLKAGTLPERICNPATCRRCGFAALCNPNMQYTALELMEDVELYEALKRRDELKEAHKEYSAIDKRVKDTLKSAKADRFIVGDYFIEKKSIPRKAYSVAASVSVRVDIEPINIGDPNQNLLQEIAS